MCERERQRQRQRLTRFSKIQNICLEDDFFSLHVEHIFYHYFSFLIFILRIIFKRIPCKWVRILVETRVGKVNKLNFHLHQSKYFSSVYLLSTHTHTHIYISVCLCVCICVCVCVCDHCMWAYTRINEIALFFGLKLSRRYVFETTAFFYLHFCLFNFFGKQDINKQD